MRRYAIFLNGPIGVGKTTLGSALAECLAGGFIDGDDFSDPERPWYCSILRTSNAIVRAGLLQLESKPSVVVAYPLGCTGWIFFKRKFRDLGVEPMFISLRASHASLIDAKRGRTFSREEQDRMLIMIAEGYGARAFSDAVVDTDSGSFEATLAVLEREARRLMSAQPSRSG